MTIDTNLPTLLDTDELSAMLRTPKASLERWRSQSSGPDFTRIGRRVFYAEHEVQALWGACDAWSSKAAALQRLADDGFSLESRAFADNQDLAVVPSPPAFDRYLRERAWNAARMLRAMHKAAFETAPGRLHIDDTVLYALMRAALEDAAAIVWQQSPPVGPTRLSRALRLLQGDARYFTENHILLAQVGASLGGTVGVHASALEIHMRNEGTLIREHFVQIATLLGLDRAQTSRMVSAREPTKTTYGPDSVELLVWKLLSDLSHFSFMMLAHLSTSPIHGSSASLRHVVFFQFAQTVSKVCDDSISHLEVAAATR